MFPVGLKLVHLHAEEFAVMVVVTADFIFNRWDLEILPCYRIRHIQWCVRYHAQILRLEAFNYYLYVGRGCGSPGLYSVGPNWFEYSFVDEEFVVYRVLICVRVTSISWWGQYLVFSVWWRCVYARWVFCRGAAQDTWPLLFKRFGHCWCEPGDMFLFTWWMWCVLT
jgi:hypothetical protein